MRREQQGSLFVPIMLVVLVSFALAVRADPPAEEANYCRDPAVNAHWGELLCETPDDDVLVRLGALRLGLCQMVEAGVIDLDRGARIFEQAPAQALIERRREEQGRKREWRL